MNQYKHDKTFSFLSMNVFFTCTDMFIVAMHFTIWLTRTLLYAFDPFLSVVGYFQFVLMVHMVRTVAVYVVSVTEGCHVTLWQENVPLDVNPGGPGYYVIQVRQSYVLIVCIIHQYILYNYTLYSLTYQTTCTSMLNVHWANVCILIYVV